MITRKYRLRVTIDQQVFNRFSTDYCLRDFSAFAAYAATAAMEISQSYPFSMRMQPCSHVATLAMEISQPSQPMPPLQQWRYLSHTHTLCAWSHAAMQSLMPWRFPSLRSLRSHCSNGDVLAIPYLCLYLC